MPLSEELRSEIHHFSANGKYVLSNFRKLYTAIAEEAPGEDVAHCFADEILLTVDTLFREALPDANTRATIAAIAKGVQQGSRQDLVGRAPPWRVYGDFGIVSRPFTKKFIRLLELWDYDKASHEVLEVMDQDRKFSGRLAVRAPNARVVDAARKTLELKYPTPLQQPTPSVIDHEEHQLGPQSLPSSPPSRAQQSSPLPDATEGATQPRTPGQRSDDFKFTRISKLAGRSTQKQAVEEAGKRVREEMGEGVKGKQEEEQDTDDQESGDSEASGEQDDADGHGDKMEVQGGDEHDASDMSIERGRKAPEPWIPQDDSLEEAVDIGEDLGSASMELVSPFGNAFFGTHNSNIEVGTPPDTTFTLPGPPSATSQSSVGKIRQLALSRLPEVVTLSPVREVTEVSMTATTPSQLEDFPKVTMRKSSRHPTPTPDTPRKCPRLDEEHVSVQPMARLSSAPNSAERRRSVANVRQPATAVISKITPSPETSLREGAGEPAPLDSKGGFPQRQDAILTAPFEHPGQSGASHDAKKNQAGQKSTAQPPRSPDFSWAYTMHSLGPKEWVAGNVFPTVLSALTPLSAKALLVDPLAVSITNPEKNSTLRLSSLSSTHRSIVIPLNFPLSHWMIALVDITARAVILYDNRHSSTNRQKAWTAVRTYLEAVDRRRASLHNTTLLHDKEWQLLPESVAPLSSTDSWNCGVYCLAVAISWIHCKPIPTHIVPAVWRYAMYALVATHAEADTTQPEKSVWDWVHLPHLKQFGVQSDSCQQAQDALRHIFETSKENRKLERRTMEVAITECGIISTLLRSASDEASKWAEAQDHLEKAAAIFGKLVSDSSLLDPALQYSRLRTDARQTLRAGITAMDTAVEELGGKLQQLQKLHKEETDSYKQFLLEQLDCLGRDM